MESWAEPGGDDDRANPGLPVPSKVRSIAVDGTGLAPEGVLDAEIVWMLAQRELRLTAQQLVRDYGEEEATEMLGKFEAEGAQAVQGALAWPGVGTRWRRFLAWWRQTPQAERPVDAQAALAGFAHALGRVRSFRALALDEAALARILEEDEIAPSGRLRPGIDAQHLRAVVEEHGVAKVAVVRLYISNMPKIGGVDPSISLHDDWQTTSIIASGYARANRRVHLFELSVPAVESLGWTLQEVADRSPAFLGPQYGEHEPWFCFHSLAVPQGTWLKGTLQRTERYGLYSVPHLRRRLLKLHVFDSVAEVAWAVEPFRLKMELQHEEELLEKERAH